MDFRQYQQAAARTIKADQSFRDRLANFGLGLGGEAGEVMEPIKKHLYHDKPLDVAALRKEIGDVLWYAAALATTLGEDLGVAAEENIAKLKARHPEGFHGGDGDRSGEGK